MEPEIPSLVSVKVPVIPVTSKVPGVATPEVLSATWFAVMVPELLIGPPENEKVNVSAFANAATLHARKAR